MATYFLNSEWAVLTTGTVVEVTGGTAVIGTDAFASAEDLTVAAGDTVAYEGGTFDSIYSAEGVTAQINKNIVYTGDTLTLSGITVNADTIDTAAAVITFTGDASSSNVNYGMVTVLGGTTAGGYVVDGDLYIKNNVYYNDSAITATEGEYNVVLDGATFKGVIGTNVFAKTAVADLNALTGAGNTNIFVGNYDTVAWGKAGFAPQSNVMVFEGGTIARSASAEGRFWLFRSVPAGDLYGALRNVTVTNVAYFYMFYGANTTADVTIDFESATVESGLRLVRANATVGNLTMNVINSSFDASVTDDAKLVVNGDFCFNVVNSTMTGNINLLSSSAGTTAKNLFFSLTNSTVSELVAHTNGIIAEGGVASLVVRGNNTAGTISAFDTITIYADGGANANLTATSIDFNGTITVDLSNVTKSGEFKVIDITGSDAQNWNVKFVNAGHSSASYSIVENDLIISVDYVSVDKVYVNNNWKAEDADSNGLITLANGNKAVWGVNVFNNITAAKEAAVDKPICIDGGIYNSEIGMGELVITGDVTITDWTGVTSVIVKNGATITTDKWSDAIKLTVDLSDAAYSDPVINYIGSSSVDYGMVNITGGTTAGGYVVDGDLYVKNNVYYNNSDLTAETTTVDVGGATFTAVWGGTASFSADKTLYNNNSSAAFPALSSSIGSDGVLVVLGGTYSYVMGEYFKGAETIFAAGNVSLNRFHFLGGTYKEDQYLTVSGTTFSSRPNHITQGMSADEGVDIYVKYDNVVSLIGTTFARIGMTMNDGTFNFEAKKSYFASLVGVAHSKADLGTMDVSLIGSTVASGEMVFGTMSTNNAKDMKTHSVSGDIVLNVTDSYIGAKVIGGHAYGNFSYSEEDPGYTCSVGGSIKMTFTGATLNGDIYGSDIKDEADNVTSSTIGGNIVITIDNSSAKNIYGNGFADLAGNVNITIANGANVTGDVKGYYDTDNVEGSVSLTVTGKNNNVSGAISNFEEINISAGATLTATSIANTGGTITIDVSKYSGNVRVIDIDNASSFGTVNLINAGSNEASWNTDENGDLWVNVTVIDTETVYFNNQWTGADDGIYVTLADGGKAVWGVNAFSDIEAAKTAAGDKVIHIDGGVYNDAIGLTDLAITGDVTINDWSGVDTITVKNGATITTNSWDGSDVLTVDLANASDAPVIDYTGSGEVTFGKVNFANGNGAAYAINGKLYAGSNVIYNNPAYTGDTEIVMGGVTFTGVYGENIFSYTDVNSLNSICGADKLTVFTGDYAASVWTKNGFNPSGNMTVFDGATITSGAGDNRIFLARGDKGGSDMYGAVINSDVSQLYYFYTMYGVANGGDFNVDITGSTFYNLYLARSSGEVDNLTINVSGSTFTGGIFDAQKLIVYGELILNISGSSVTDTINLMQAANTNISKITVTLTNSTVNNIYACDAGKVDVSQDELILKGTNVTGAIDNFETVTITAGSVVKAHKLSAGTINVTLGEITEDIRIIDTGRSLKGTLNITNPDALPAGFELIQFNGDLWAVNTSDPTKVIGREVTVNEVAAGDAFEGVTITNNIYGAKADAGAVNVAFSMNNTVAKSIFSGGNNFNAEIDTISVNLTDTTFNTFYGGGYNHTTGAIEVNLDSVLAKKMVYGGNVVNSNNSKNSTVSTVDSVSLTISGGRFEDQVVGGGRVVASASGTTTEVSSFIGEVDFTVTSDAAGFSAVFNESVFGAGYVIGNHADTTAELYVGKVRMVLNGMIMNDVADKVSDGIYGGGLAAGKAVLTVGGVQPFAVEEADEAVCITVESGSYTSIYGGGWAENKATVTVYGVSIEVLDGTIADLYGGGNNDTSGARTYIEGDVFISIGGGKVDNIHAGAKYGTSRVNGSSTVQIAGTATIGNIYGWTQTGADSVRYDQILDVDASLSCNSISHFDIIDIASGKDIDIASAFDLSGVELNIAEQTDAWDVLCATELTGLAAARVTLNGQEATWNRDNNWFASTNYTLTVQENTVDDKTTYSLVFGKLA